MHCPARFWRDAAGENMQSVWQQNNLHQAFEAMFWLARLPISVRESTSFVNLGENMPGVT